MSGYRRPERHEIPMVDTRRSRRTSIYSNGETSMSFKSLVAGIPVIVFASTAIAAGSTSPSAPPSAQASTYDVAVRAVKSGDYRRAITLLRSVTRAQPRNADAWNYAGFSHRQLGEYDQALAAYKKALAIDPEHLGANEYLGELYLKMGMVDKAKERLEALNKACSFGCEEYDELKSAIQSHKSS